MSTKKTIDAVYQEKAQFNLTNLIRKKYEAGNPLTKEDLEGVDFLEESNKAFLLPLEGKYNRQHRYEVKESLAENLVAMLPFEYYKDYIEPNWIVTSNLSESGLINRALNENKYDFIYEMLTLCKKHLETNLDPKNREHQKYISSYENSFMAPILDIGGRLEVLRNLGGTQEDYNNYFTLFKTALNDFKEYYKQKSEQIYSSSINLDEKKWFVDYRKLETAFRRFTKKEELIREVVSRPKAFNIYKDIFSQYEKSEINPILSLANLESAMSHVNKKVVAHMCEQQFLTQKEINFVFEKVLVDWSEIQMNKVNRSYENKLGDDSTYLKALIDIIQKSIPSHEIENYELFSHVLPASNEKLFNDILKLYPKLTEEKLSYDLTLNQWNYAKTLFNEFIESQNLKVVQSENDCNYPSYDMYYMQKLTEHFTPTKEITPDEKMAVNEVVAQYYLPLLDSELNEKQRATIFYTFTLNKQLEDKKVEQKKLKI